MNTSASQKSETIKTLEINTNSLDKEIKEAIFDIENSVNAITCNTKFCFKDFLSIIDKEFNFTPCIFYIGKKENAAWENTGSLKVITYAIMMWYDTQEALKLFGEHYKEVCETPDGDSHPNIRALQEEGLKSVHIVGTPLTMKAQND